MISFTLRTLGCKVNQCDGEALAARLADAGWARAAREEDADIFIINTCTVTHTVDKKSLRYIRRARRLNPGAFVAVCGCMTENKQALALNVSEGGEADIMFNTREPRPLLDALAARYGSPRSAAAAPPALRTRAFLKVQDGCDRFCAYCIVPYVRGTLTSVPITQAVAQAQALINDGVKEIVLTGIQLGAYGKDMGGEKPALPALLRAVAAVNALPRLRLSSLEPQAVTPAFLDAVSAGAVCDHFHLSLQSGCNDTLTRMDRRYSTEEYARAAEALRRVHPGAALTTDLIVGFPGETESDFEESLAFVNAMQFARVHVFPFSARAGTRAAAMDNPISPAEKKRRAAQALVLSARLQRMFYQAQVGHTREVLFETPATGLTRNYAPVTCTTHAVPNTLKNVRIIGFRDEALTGEIL